jgi:hypothetical protein
MSDHAKRRHTGIRGAQLVADELISQRFSAELMSPYNRGFDIRCGSPTNRPFRVEVKCSTSTGTQVPMQTKSHLEAPLQSDLFYVFVRPPSNPSGAADFYVMTHSEIHAAWAKMPREKHDGTPYKIGATGYIDWKHILAHRSSWHKLPQ